LRPRHYAARLAGLPTGGIDHSAVAVAIAKAKLANTTEAAVLRLARRLLASSASEHVPSGKFWTKAYQAQTLGELCKLRGGLLRCRDSDAAHVLRAIALGALHGPLSKNPAKAGYFSNQMPRTFAPKPDYAIRYWTKHQLDSRHVDVLSVIQRRLRRALATSVPPPRMGAASVVLGDSREPSSYAALNRTIGVVITSPPYYGLRTYQQDQWLRSWMLGGPSHVDYSHASGLDHAGPERFAQSLARVWNQIGERAAPGIEMFVRFGAIGSRHVDARDLLDQSLKLSEQNWTVIARWSARSSERGKRQARQMGTIASPTEEYDSLIRIRR
jgi:hypothetical protein